ncbi:MAG: hypothetical protein KGI69_00770 [Patescibacteria group bacterium]|nr:hypothetical protein [Patescibacteria group bacterium]
MNRNLTALILVVLAVGVYFTVTSGMIADAGTVKSVNDQYSSALANAARLIAVRDQVLQQYNNISPTDQARLDKMIPSTVDNIRLIIDLSNVALRHGFSLQNAKATVAGSQGGAAAAAAPTAAQPSSAGSSPLSISTPTLDTVTVSFGATATYDQFISFLQDLEADLRIIDLTHLTMTSSDTGVYSFQVQFQTYWLRQ